MIMIVMMSCLKYSLEYFTFIHLKWKKRLVVLMYSLV